MLDKLNFDIEIGSFATNNNVVKEIDAVIMVEKSTEVSTDFTANSESGNNIEIKEKTNNAA